MQLAKSPAYWCEYPQQQCPYVDGPIWILGVGDRARIASTTIVLSRERSFRLMVIVLALSPVIQQHMEPCSTRILRHVLFVTDRWRGKLAQPDKSLWEPLAWEVVDNFPTQGTDVRRR